jgi:hypothetical protein
MRNAYNVLVEESEHYFRGIGTDGRIILKQMLAEQAVSLCVEFNWIRMGFSGGSCGCTDETLERGVS